MDTEALISHLACGLAAADRRAFRKAAEAALLVSNCDGLDLDQPLRGRERSDTDEGAGWRLQAFEEYRAGLPITGRSSGL